MESSARGRTDAARMLDYCQSKGLVLMDDASPVEAIVAQLTQENRGMIHPLLVNPSDLTVEIATIPVSRVRASNPHHFDSLRSSAIQSDTAAEDALIAGVLIDIGASLYLLDGHHRLKWLHETGVKEANYVVLRGYSGYHNLGMLSTPANC